MEDLERYHPLTDKFIVGFGYKARTGKDTAAQYLVDNYGFKRLAFADKVKEVTHEIFGTNPDMSKLEKRFDTFASHLIMTSDTDFTEPLRNESGGVSLADLFQFVGNNLREVINENIWLEYVLEEMLRTPEQNRWVISDVRYMNEAKTLQALEAFVYQIYRPKKDRGDTGRDDNHVSETQLDDFDDWDGTLINDSTLTRFYRSIDRIVMHRPLEQNDLFLP